MIVESRWQRWLLDVGAYAVLVAMCLFTLIPLLWSAITSFRPESEILSATLTYIPRQLTLIHYQNLWNRTDFPLMFWNSTVVTVGTVVITLALSIFAAYSLSRYRMRGRSGVLMFYMGIQMFPAVLMLIPIYIMWRNLGLLNSRMGLSLAEVTFLMPVAVWMLKGFFDAIPEEIEEAARIDGCSRIGALLRVVLPILRPGLTATGVFIAIAAWNELLFAMLLSGTRESMTWPVGLQSLVGEYQLSWGMLGAGGVISIIPVIIFFMMIQRTLVKGLISGALKG